jgi:uncharacterized membrane protein
VNKTNFSLDRSGLLDVERLKTMTDGVYAIVITIMILEINIPSDHTFSDEGLWKFLLKIRFEVYLYAISFLLVATYWIQHCVMFQLLTRANRHLYWLNILALFPVTLLPSVTELKGLYPSDSASILVAGSVSMFTGVCLLILWIYIYAHPELVGKPIPPSLFRSMTYRILLSPIGASLIAVIVSFLNVHLGGALLVSVPLVYFWQPEIDRHTTNEESEQ